MMVAVTAGDRATRTTWKQHADGHYQVTVHFDVGDERSFTVTFPGTMGDIVYTPGLLETPVHVPRDAFVFDHFELALSDGLIGLGGGKFVVKDQASVHISATVVPGSGDVVFHDDTGPGGEVIDSIVLACTHFPLLRPELDEAAQQIFGADVRFFDGSAGIARRIAQLTAGQDWPVDAPYRRMIINGQAEQLGAAWQSFAALGFASVEAL